MRLAQITGINQPGTPLQFFSFPNDFLAFWVSRFLRYAVTFAGFFFLIQLLVAGYTYLTSTGDPSKVQAATKTLTHATIGLVVCITAFAITQILQTIFKFDILKTI